MRSNEDWCVTPDEVMSWDEWVFVLFGIDTETITEIEEIDRVASKVDTILKDSRRR